jgi:hypothetical protein
MQGFKGSEHKEVAGGLFFVEEYPMITKKGPPHKKGSPSKREKIQIKALSLAYILHYFVELRPLRLEKQYP